MKNAVLKQQRFRPALESLEDRRVCSVNSLAFLSEALTTVAVVKDQLVETATVIIPAAPVSTVLNAPLATVVDVATTTLPGTLDTVVEIGAVLTTEVTTLVSEITTEIPLGEVLGAVLDAPLATVVDVVTTTLPGTLDAVVEIGAVLTTEVATVIPLDEVLGAVLDAPLATVVDVVTTTLPGTLDAVVEIGAVLTTEVTTVIPLDEVLGAVLDAPVAVVVDIVTTTLPEVPGASELPPVVDVGAESPTANLPGGPNPAAVVNQTVLDSNASAASNLWWMQFSVAANTALFMQQLAAVQNADMENSRDMAIASGLNIVLTDMQLLAEINDAAVQALAANFPSEFGEEWLTWELLDLEETLASAIGEAGILAGTGLLGLGMLAEAFDDFLRELAELQRTLWNWLAQIGPMPWILMAAAALVSVREGVRWRLQHLQTPRVSPLGLQIC